MFSWSTKSRLAPKQLVGTPIWHVHSKSDWLLRKVTHRTLLVFIFAASIAQSSTPTSVNMKYFYRRRDEVSCWSASVSRMKLSQSFNKSPEQPSWQLQRCWSRWDTPMTLSFISPLAPPVSLSASSNTVARLTFLVIGGSDALAQSKSSTGTSSCTFD